MELPIYMQPGSLVVFEGLDNTGKSTQMERFERACYAPDMGTPLYEPTPMFTHQPSGATGIGPAIYELTESVDWREADPLTRQYLHLAAHTEHYVHDILPALEHRAVVMDRCWWSTVAYGWRGSMRSRFDGLDEYIKWCRIPAHLVTPDVVFLFMSQFGDDPTATSDRITRRNYEKLATRYWNKVELVPRLGVGETTAFIAGQLNRRGITTIHVEEDF